MSKEVEQVDLGKEIARLNEQLRRKDREIKGWKGRATRIERHSGAQEPKLSPEVTGTSQNEPAQVEKPHMVRSWEKFCPDCGGLPNPNYVKPNVKCTDCGSPLGNVKKEDIKTDEKGKETLDIPPCWNCGSAKVDVDL